MKDWANPCQTATSLPTGTDWHANSLPPGLEREVSGNSTNRSTEESPNNNQQVPGNLQGESMKVHRKGPRASSLNKP